MLLIDEIDSRQMSTGAATLETALRLAGSARRRSATIRAHPYPSGYRDQQPVRAFQSPPPALLVSMDRVPGFEKERTNINRKKRPASINATSMPFMQEVRKMRLEKVPGIAETLD